MNLKLIIDHVPGIRVIATGSSSFELAKDVGEPLTGRKFVLKLFPYLDLLEKVFVIFRLSGFSRNLRKEISKSHRFFFYDNGIRNVLKNPNGAVIAFRKISGTVCKLKKIMIKQNSPADKAQIVYLSHGGGPLPILGDPSHKAMVDFMLQLPSQLRHPDAILVISAHREESAATLLGARTPAMLYDYYGFPDQRE